MNDALLGALVGGGLAILGGIVGHVYQQRFDRKLETVDTIDALVEILETVSLIVGGTADAGLDHEIASYTTIRDTKFQFLSEYSKKYLRAFFLDLRRLHSLRQPVELEYESFSADSAWHMPTHLSGMSLQEACVKTSISVTRIGTLIGMLRDERVEPGIIADSVELSEDSLKR
jgi:hypothetical protein